MAYTLTKSFRNFNGLNFSLPELLRDNTYATDLLNVRLSENLSLSKRRGYQIQLANQGGGGSVTYNETDIATGTQTVGRFIIDENLKELITKTLTLSYSGVDNGSAQFSLNPETQIFSLKLFEDGNLVEEISCGTGLEITPFNLGNLVSGITNPNFSLNIGTASPSLTAAFIKTTGVLDLTSPKELYIKEIETKLTPDSFVGNPFSAHWAARNNPGWQIASTLQAHDVLYITTENDGLWKYDGDRIYKAGLPKPNTPTLDAETGTPIANSNWSYRVIFRFKDAKDNTVYSEWSEPLNTDAFDTAFTQDIDVDVSNLANGWDTDGGIEAILLRTTNNGTIYYEVDTIVIGTNPTTITFNIVNLYDTVLVNNPQFSPQTIPATVPPNCRYIDIWRNQIVLTGNPAAVDTVYVADIENLEGFSLLSSFQTSSRLGSSNTGIKSLDNHLFVFKARSITVVTGSLAGNSLQVDTISDEGIGALSHNSIIEYEKNLYFVSQNGVYTVNNSGISPISNELIPLFFNYSFNEERITGFHWINERKLLFLLPKFNTETIAGNPEQILDKVNSRILVYDLYTRAWSIWNNIDFSCGMNLDKDGVWFSSRLETSEFLFTKSDLDYADHENPIDWFYKAHWETLGEPSIPKKFNRLKVYTIDTEFQTFESTNFDLSVETNHNYYDQTVSQTSLNFGGDALGWGLFLWGDTPWGELKSTVRATRLAAKRAQALRVVFKNNKIHENVLISGFELEVSPLFRPAIKDR